jgi:hypothetical protein
MQHADNECKDRKNGSDAVLPKQNCYPGLTLFEMMRRKEIPEYAKEPGWKIMLAIRRTVPQYRLPNSKLSTARECGLPCRN